GILGRFNRRHLKPLQYLVFKVRWWRSHLNIPFQPLVLARGTSKNRLKAFISKPFQVGDTLILGASPLSP
ncbi:MAG TPA: hypothetical protein DCP31_25270, partial [Cyanobacteria bacterium UBA8543]|nr:hypothetical protein [Cyanobacteria bacterium UBA8543]